MSKPNSQETYKGVIIRESNIIRIRVGKNKFKEIIDEVEKTGLSIPKIISLSGRPCDKCKGMNVINYSDDGTKIEIKRGLLSDLCIMSNGINIIKNSSNKSTH